MKKLIYLLAIVASVSLANAQKMQDKAVPATIKSAFKKSYPNATDVKWEKEKNNYEVGFLIAKTKHSVLMDHLGKTVETEVDIKTEQLPNAAKNYISKKYPGKKITEAAKITDAKGVVTYEAEINDKDLIFDHVGSFLKAIVD